MPQFFLNQENLVSLRGIDFLSPRVNQQHCQLKKTTPTVVIRKKPRRNQPFRGARTRGAETPIE
ncbi:hypothetical protein Pla144_11230 [Bythopirellula polymerisocia]|uniref:Uncharacterized protein n=1 Tax=Bythopirellula polymerisocia TaxID=2528003 RepID=A0A5C6D3U5_9BACT|nr:hypothetical protein Pla144_11230 [Bythopirellula polymerisocia]